MLPCQELLAVHPYRDAINAHTLLLYRSEWQTRLGKLRMLLEDRDREVDDLRSLLADREGRIQQLVEDLHQRHDGGEGGFRQHGSSALGRAEGGSAGAAQAVGALLTTTGHRRGPAALARQEGS